MDILKSELISLRDHFQPTLAMVSIVNLRDHQCAIIVHKILEVYIKINTITVDDIIYTHILQIYTST